VRNFAGWEGFDGWARNAMFKILGEDKVMVEKLTPERLEAEFSLGPDAPQVITDWCSSVCVCVCVDTESTWVHASSLTLCVCVWGGGWRGLGVWSVTWGP
jgi:hypothetical protein